MNRTEAARPNGDDAPRPLDTTRVFETPEGIELELKTAGPVVRAAAWAIDAAIRTVLYIGVALLLSWFGGLGFGVMLIFFFLIEWFYPVVFEVYRNSVESTSVL